MNCTGFLSNQECNFSPFKRFGEITAKAGASTNSFSTGEPCLTVLIMLYTNTITPVRYKVPPTARIQYIGINSVTVSRKFPYCNLEPSASNCFHIEACVNPATYIGSEYKIIPKVPIQKWKFANFSENNFVFVILGINQ